MAIFIRHNEQISVLNKVRSFAEPLLAEWINAGRFFGFHTKVDWEEDGLNGHLQTADGQSFIDVTSRKYRANKIKVYVHGGECWIALNKIPKNTDKVSSYKVLLPRSGNPGSIVIGKPKISEPNSCSSNTYVVILPPEGIMSKEQAENLLSYIKTKFFRFLVAAKTTTQSTSSGSYDFVPLQDFSRPWTDAELYEKYGLSQDEIKFIEATIKPMD